MDAAMNNLIMVNGGGERDVRIIEVFVDVT